MLFGLVTKKGLETFKEDQKRDFDERERKLRKEFNRSSTLQFSSTSITIADLVQKVSDLIKPDFLNHLKSLVSELDLTEVTDKAWDELDMESLENKLTEALKDRVVELLKADPDNLVNAIAESIIENNLDTDDIASQVAENITERIQLKPSESDS